MKFLTIVILISVNSCAFQKTSKSKSDLTQIKIIKTDSSNRSDTFKVKDLYPVLDQYFKKIDGIYKY